MKDLPQGWTDVALKDIADKPQYGFTAKADYKVRGPKLLRITDIQDSS